MNQSIKLNQMLYLLNTSNYYSGYRLLDETIDVIFCTSLLTKELHCTVNINTILLLSCSCYFIILLKYKSGLTGYVV